MSNTVKQYIEITKENYKKLNDKERMVCLIHVEDYLDEKGYNYQEVKEIVNQIKAEA